MLDLLSSSAIIFDFLWRTALKQKLYNACPNDDVCVCVYLCLSVCKLFFLFFFFLFHLENNSFFSLRPAGSVIWLDEGPTLYCMGVSFKGLICTFVTCLKLFPMIRSPDTLDLVIHSCA